MDFMPSINKLLIIISLGLYLPLNCQEMWLERNSKHIVAGSKIAFTLFGLYVHKILGNRMFKLRPVDDSDPFKKMCMGELSAIGVDNPETVSIKVSDDSMFDNNAQAKYREIIMNQTDYDSYRKADGDKDTIRFTVRHEGSHIKNHDFIKMLLGEAGLFNTFLYGSSSLMRSAELKGYLPENTKVKSLIKIIGPIAVAYKVTPFVTNFYRSICERHADKDAATNLALAQAGARAMEVINKEQQHKPQSRSNLVTWLIKNPLLHRMIIGYEIPEIRLQRMLGYVSEFEKQ